MDKQRSETPKKKWPGLFPVVKSFLLGNNDSDVLYDGEQTYVNASGDNLMYSLLSGSHSFGRRSLRNLVEVGYSNNPAVFGMIIKIILAQRNINFIPYWGGKPYKSKTYDLDTNFALQMILLTGTAIIYKKEIVGFPHERTVLNTLDVEELPQGNGQFKYRLWKDDGSWVMLDNSSMIFIKIFDVARRNTRMGLSPLQAALMPIESLKEMYTADTSTLKNKGVDVLITNDSDVPITEDEQDGMDKSLNRRLRGARKSGGVATSTARLRVQNIGRTTKELALWDGYKIKVRDICNALQIDSSLFNDPDNKKYANVQEANKALYNDCVIPFTKLITENKELKADLGYDIYLDLSNIDCLQEAQNTRAEKAKTITEAIVGLNAQVKTSNISVEIAIKILVSEWEFDPQEAAQFIMVPETQPDPEPEKT